MKESCSSKLIIIVDTLMISLLLLGSSKPLRNLSTILHFRFWVLGQMTVDDGSPGSIVLIVLIVLCNSATMVSFLMWIFVSSTFWVFFFFFFWNREIFSLMKNIILHYILLNYNFFFWFQAAEEPSLLMSSPRMLLPVSGTLPPGAPLSVHHQIQLLQQQLQQQQQQTHVAVAQVSRLICSH